MLTIQKPFHRGLALAAAAGLAGLVAGCTPPGPRAVLDGERLIREDRPFDAIRRLKVAVELMPGNATAWNFLGLAHHRALQPEEASAAYQQALRLDRSFAPVHFNLGCLYFEQGSPDRAVEALNVYVALQPGAVDAWRLLGQAQLRTRQFEAAARSFSTVLEHHPDEPAALNGLGIALQQRRRPREAWECFSKALKQDPNFPPAWLNLAVAAQQVGARPQAIQAYRQYANLRPEAARAVGVDSIIRHLTAPAPVPVPAPAEVPSPTGIDPNSLPPSAEEIEQDLPPSVDIPDHSSLAHLNLSPEEEADYGLPGPGPSPRFRADEPLPETLGTRSPGPTQASTQHVATPPRPVRGVSAESEGPLFSSTSQGSQSASSQGSNPPSTRRNDRSQQAQSTPTHREEPERATRPPSVPAFQAAARPSPTSAVPPAVNVTDPARRSLATSTETPTATPTGTPTTMAAATPPAAAPAATPALSTSSSTQAASRPLVRPVGAQRAVPEESRGFWDRANPARWFRQEGESGVSAGAGRDPSRGTTPTTASQSQGGGAGRASGVPAAGTSPSSSSPTVSKPMNVAMATQPPRYRYTRPPRPSPGNPAAARPLLQQAIQEQRRGQLEAAVSLYGRALQQDPAAFEAYQNLAAAHLDAGELPKALTSSETALVLRPDSVPARLNFALALERAGYPVDAAVEARHIVTAKPDEVPAHLLLGNLYSEHLNDPRRARVHYARVIELAPGHPQNAAIRRWLSSNPLP